MLVVLSFENKNDLTSYMRYFLRTVERKDYNVMIVGSKKQFKNIW